MSQTCSRRIQTIVCGIVLAILLPFSARAGELVTYYATIRYSDDAHLIDFGRKVGGSRISLTRDKEKSKALIAETVDRIVYRVRTLLDMHPPGFHSDIFIHATYGELRSVYRELGLTGEAPVAFYTNKGSSVHLSLEDLNDGILAHEIAHAIINRHYDPPLPAKMQEILAQYVDRHLWDE